MSWKEKLTPYDSELCVMVESLTARPCEPKNGGDHYFIEVDYTEHEGDEEYKNAVINAIEGRLGARMITIDDRPERKMLFVKVKFSDSGLPRLLKRPQSEPHPFEGNPYCRRVAIIRAMEVNRHNFKQLCDFVGGGEMEIPKKGPCEFHFINAGSVWVHVPEGSFIVHVQGDQFQILDRKTFYQNYELR